MKPHTKQTIKAVGLSLAFILYSELSQYAKDEAELRLLASMVSGAILYGIFYILSKP